MMKLKTALVFLLCTICFGSLKAQKFYRQTAASQYWVDSVFNSLTPAQRIAQLMVVRESSVASGRPVFLNAQVEKLIRDYNIGSICLFQGGPLKQAQFLNYFQQIAQTPLMVCIDGETGLGMRMTDSVFKFPDQLTIGAVQDAALAYEVGKAIGDQCKRIGIQVNYAPVVDINNNPNNPVINFRSFGEDRYKVALLGTQLMRGMQEENVMACAKHFPGHGDVSVDSHLDLPVISKSFGALDSLELYPFKALFNEGVGSVMIAHLSIPAIDNTPHLPTSLSQKNVTGLLRNQLGFKGISFTDALEMQGVAKYYPQGEAAVQSLLAGNDMLCLPGDVPQAIQKIQTAIANKVLDSIDINNRVKKVLLAKYNLGLNKVGYINPNNLYNDLNKDVLPLRKKVARNAFTLLRLKDDDVFPLKPGKKIAYVGVGEFDTSGALATFLKIEKDADVFLMNYNDGAAVAAAIEKAVDSNYDAVIIGVHGLKKYPSGNFGLSANALGLIKNLQSNNKALTMLFGNPYALKNFCDADNVMACYEDDATFQEAAFSWLEGEFVAQGKLPVTVCDAFHYGDGIVNLGLKELQTASPAEVGLDSAKLFTIDSLASDAIAQHATPGCVVMVVKDNKIVLDKAYGKLTYYTNEPATLQSVYDLASVTKISATTISVMKLWEEGLLDLDKTLGYYLPWVRGTSKSNLTLRNVLLHQAGLIAFIPFYKEIIEANGDPQPGYFQRFDDSGYSVHVADTMYMRNDWVDTMYARILQSWLSPKKEFVYSDNDFIFLGKIAEQLTGLPLNEYVAKTFYKPMHLYNTTFKPNEHIPINNIAPTEEEQYFRLQLLRGYVHDPGAAMFGGVAGHAGLFSNAHDLAILYSMLLNGGVWDGVRYLKKETIDYFTAYGSNISRRGLGWDKPEKDNYKQDIPYPCLSASPQTYGHTGFTGIGIWVDPKYDLIFIFLSNRVNPDGGSNNKLSTLKVRMNMMETIYQSMLNK
ncbi:glycoside hydrolase family 3 N-terminal domain-containing protein [Parafilimonas sp.]|uniref:glycoside hydrolase family 3 N-terminal domain-containing protein n=1 Tax=Parafilimonas sp. TaxID=1969739 RepID=UPI0039E4A97E